MEAYDLAVWYGSCWLEMDLVTSKSGGLWISHDDTAIRMTGIDKKVSDMTDEEISELKTLEGGKILSIEEVFDRYYSNSGVGFNIAIRDTLWNTQWEDLKSVLSDYDEIAFKLIIQGQLAETMRLFKEYNSDIETLFLATDDDIYNDIIKDEKSLKYIDIIAVSSFYMDNGQRKNEVQSKGISYAVYTINSTAEITDAITRGIDFYFTAKALLLEQKYR